MGNNIAAMCAKLQLCKLNISALHQSEMAVGTQWSYFEDRQLLDFPTSGNSSGFNKWKTKQQFWDSSTQSCNKELIANISFVVNAHARVVFSQFFSICICLAVLNSSENPSIFLFIFRSEDSAKTRTKARGVQEGR